MSQLPESVMADVATFPRWYRCEPCDVAWRGTDAECWSCESDKDVVPHYPPTGKDMHTAGSDAPVIGVIVPTHRTTYTERGVTAIAQD